MNKFELHLMYKNETSNTHEDMTANAYMSKISFDVILDSDDLDERILAMLPPDNSGREVTISFPDPEYHKWLEEKVSELLKK